MDLFMICLLIHAKYRFSAKSEKSVYEALDKE
mgnify:CR=1 FL=1